MSGSSRPAPAGVRARRECRLRRGHGGGPEDRRGGPSRPAGRSAGRLLQDQFASILPLVSDRRDRLTAYRGSPDRTHLLGVPSRAPPCGRHRTTSSIFRASSKSLSVMPPAAWFWSLTTIRPQVTVRSG